jgi:hypothetical protein
METIVLHWISSEDIAKGHKASSYERRVQEYIKRNNLVKGREFRADEDDLGIISALSDILRYLNENKTKKFELLAYKEPPWQQVGDIEKCFTDRRAANTLERTFLYDSLFEEPADHNTAIWRYITLPKLLDMFQTKELFFTRADKLRELDKSEGRYFTLPEERLNDAMIFTANHAKNTDLEQIRDLGAIAEMRQSFNDFNEKRMIKEIFINCWHIAPQENIAMWKIYSDNFGVCIKSTYNKLCDSFIDKKIHYYHKERRLKIGAVKYIDQNAIRRPENHQFWHYIHKSIEYEFEKELRCITQYHYDEDSAPHGGRTPQEFLRAEINIQELVEEVILHPAAPDWYRKILVNLFDKYDVKEIPIQPSSLP